MEVLWALALVVTLLFASVPLWVCLLAARHIASRLDEQQAPKSTLGLVQAKHHDGNSPDDPKGTSHRALGVGTSTRRGSDLIFVHGLGSNPDTTWQATKYNDDSANPAHTSDKRAKIKREPVDWIRDYLEVDLANDLREDLRIFYFNHDSYWRRDALGMRLDEIARNLLASLQSLASHSHGAVQRDIIIISHSYGGLVVKKALVLASESQESPIDIVKGVVFLGCPHQGTKVAMLGQAVARALWLLNADAAVFSELNYRSSALDELQASYSRLAHVHKIRTINFYEKRAMDLSGCRLPFFNVKIVPEDSAKLGCLYEFPLETDHSGLNKYPSRHSPGYGSIRAHLTDILQSLEEDREKRAQERYVVPKDLVSTFVPRSALQGGLEKLISSPLARDQTLRFVTLVGAGGTGKTQLVLNFLQTYRARYDVVLWLNASSAETVRSSFKACADALFIPFATENNDACPVQDAPEVRAVKSWLATRIFPGQQWLVVVDNADDLDWGVRQIIPREGNGTVIITSRDNYAPNLAGHNSLRISIEAMQPREARTLLLKASIDSGSGNTHHNEVTVALADEIVARLQFLPVAVDLAGAYIRETRGQKNITSAMRQYLRYYDSNKDRLLKQNTFKDLSTYNQTVWTTWDTTLRTIEKQYMHQETQVSVSPLDLLTFLSLFGRSGIHHNLFELASVGFAQVAPDFFVDSFGLPCWLKSLLAVDGQKQWNDWTFNEAMAPLQRYNLVQSQGRDGEAYSMHELIRWRANSDAGNGAWRTWYTIFLAMLIDQESPPASRGTLRRQIVPHLPSVNQIEEVLQNVETFRRTCTWYALGLAWYEEGRYATASEHFEKALQCEYGEAQQDLRVELASITMLTTCRRKLGQLMLAEILAQRRIELIARRCPESGSDHWAASAALASIWRLQGKFESAQELGERVVCGSFLLFGDEHQRTVTAKKDLALTYAERGLYDKAEQLQLEIVKARRLSLGEYHRRYVDAQCNLADSWFGQGKYAQARELQEQMLKAKIADLGELHPDTLHTLSHLAMTMFKLGKYDTAGILGAKAAKGLAETLGDDHMDTLQSRSNLAEIYLWQNRLEESVALNKEVLQQKRRVCGPEHPDTLTSMNNLAGALWEFDQKEEAWELMARTLEGMVRTLGFDHWKTIEVAKNLGWFNSEAAKL